MVVNLLRGLRRHRSPRVKRRGRPAAIEALELRQLLSGVAVIGGPPTIGSLTAAPDPVYVGDPVTLTANDVTGRAVRVYFYREPNGQPGLQTDIDPATDDLLVGSDNTAADGYSIAAPTSGLATYNQYRYYAQATGIVGVLHTRFAAAG